MGQQDNLVQVLCDERVNRFLDDIGDALQAVILRLYGNVAAGCDLGESGPGGPLDADPLTPPHGDDRAASQAAPDQHGLLPVWYHQAFEVLVVGKVQVAGQVGKRGPEVYVVPVGLCPDYRGELFSSPDQLMVA